jgi:transposase
MAKKGRRATEEERIQAVQLIESGRKVDEVAEIMGIGRSTVLDWWRKYREGGLAALSTKFASGRPTVLTDEQLLELRVLLIGSDPRQFSLGFALWTRSLVGELIKQRFKKTLSAVTVGRILKKLGMSPQRPIYRAYQQDPVKVSVWKQETYPRIRAEAAECDGVVLFADEAAVRTDYHAGTTWGAIGQTPVVPVTGERKTVNMISAIGPRGDFRFQLHEGSFRAVHFIEFCKSLLRDFSKPIFLIVDGSTVHTAKIVKDFVASTEGRLRLYFLPPYSPELNPDEWVWKHVKHDTIGRIGLRSKNEFTAIIRSALAGLQKTPHVLRSFFHDSNLTYIRGCGT